MTVWSQSLGLQSKSHFEKVCLKLFLLLGLFSDTEGWVSTTLAWTIKSEKPLKFEYYDWSSVTTIEQLSVSRAQLMIMTRYQMVNLFIKLTTLMMRLTTMCLWLFDINCQSMAVFTCQLQYSLLAEPNFKHQNRGLSLFQFGKKQPLLLNVGAAIISMKQQVNYLWLGCWLPVTGPASAEQHSLLAGALSYLICKDKWTAIYKTVKSVLFSAAATLHPCWAGHSLQ